MFAYTMRLDRPLKFVCCGLAALLTAGCEFNEPTYPVATERDQPPAMARAPVPIRAEALPVTARPAPTPVAIRPGVAPVTASQVPTPVAVRPEGATVMVRPASTAAAAVAPVVVGVDAALTPYRAVQTVSGPLRSVGSDSMDRLMQLWEAEFKKTHAEIAIRHEGKGSGTAMPALMKGLCDLGPMSRPVTAEEVASFDQRFDHPPTQVRVAVDALAVLVHPSNPIAKTGLSFQQLDAIFSSTHKRGSEDIVTWGQLGLTGQWADAPIAVYSRNKASGTYVFFREHVLNKGDYKTTNQELSGSEEVIKAVASDPFAIGFCSVGYVTPEVAAAPLSAAAGQSVIAPSRETAYSKQYPLARYFYLTVNYGPEQPLTPQVQEFIRFVLSRDGQTSVASEGLFPISATLAHEEMVKINLDH
jgi:phosphate transport system substrate-binding protein